MLRSISKSNEWDAVDGSKTSTSTRLFHHFPLLRFYRSPSKNARLFFGELELALSASSSMQHLRVVGDPNIDIQNTTNTVVNTSEELRTKLVSSCIDHICIRAPNFRMHSAVIHEKKLADHYFVGCRVTLNSASILEPKISQQVKSIGTVSLDQSIASYDWDSSS